MAENALWLSSKRIDAATLVASSEEGTLVVGYLQDRRPEKKHRFTGCTAEYYTFDFGQDVACNSLALVGHNLLQQGSCSTFSHGLIAIATMVLSPQGAFGLLQRRWPALAATPLRSRA